MCRVANATDVGGVLAAGVKEIAAGKPRLYSSNLTNTRFFGWNPGNLPQGRIWCGNSGGGPL